MEPYLSNHAIFPQLSEQLEWNSVHLELSPGCTTNIMIPQAEISELVARTISVKANVFDAYPRSLSSIVRSLISIPDNLTAAIVSGSSSRVTSNSFSIDPAALLKAFRRSLQGVNCDKKGG